MHTMSPPPAKQLVILELNHVLCLRSLHGIAHYPQASTFLAILFECFHVAVWTNMTHKHGLPLVKEIFDDYYYDLEFCWFRSMTRCVGEDWDRVKPLAKVTKKFPQWTLRNTVIVDWHADKLRCNPTLNTVIIENNDYGLVYQQLTQQFTALYNE